MTDSYNEVVSPAVQPVSGDSTHVKLKPSSIFYLSWLLVLLAPFQYGWCVSQLNLNAYANEDACKRDGSQEDADKCLVFNHHSKLDWILVINAWVLGGSLGSLLSGPPSDLLGRRGAVIVNCIIMGVGGALEAFSPAVWMLVVGRLLSGIASGFGSAVTGVYISEISPAHLRGFFTTGLGMSIVIGALLVCSFLFIASSETGWRVLCAVPIAIAAVQLFGAMTFMVESPRWLHSKGKKDACRQVLGKLYGHENVEVALAQMEISDDNDEEAQVQGAESNDETSVDSNDSNADKTNPWRLLFGEYSGQLLAVVGLAMGQQLSGINAVFYYSNNIFKDAGLSDDRVGTIVAAAVNAVATIAAMAIIDKFAKRTLLLTSTLVMMLSAVGMTVAFLVDVSALSIVFVAIYVAGFALGLGPIVWMYASELFPTNVRSHAMAFGNCINWLANLAVGVGFPYVSDALTKDFSFVPFVVFLFLSLVFIYFKVPETTGKTLEEIQLEFQSKKQHDRPTQCK